MWGDEQILKCSGRMIDTTDFKAYYSVRENRTIVENLLWFWSNLLADGVEHAAANGSASSGYGEQRDSRFTNLEKKPTIGEKLAGDSGLLEVLHCLAFAAGTENLAVAKVGTIHGTALWTMQNVCLHPTFVTGSQDTVFQKFIQILRQILFVNMKFEEDVNSSTLLSSAQVLSKLL